jgi:hypothetical protein
MLNYIIVGIDASITSTGICIYSSFSEKKMNFYRIIYTDNLKKESIFEGGINKIYYSLPINVNSWKITSEDFLSDRDQMEGSLKGMMIKKIIENIIEEFIKKENNKEVNIYFVIENFILPTYSGKTQLKTTGNLIGLNFLLREIFINLSVKGWDVKYFYPSPSRNKKSFTLNGSADKQMMEDIFINIYNGKSLIEIDGKVDDIIDAFSLMIYAMNFIMGNPIKDFKEKKDKKIEKNKKLKKEKKDIYADTLIIK